ncbi:MAG: hypothetical protein IPN29_17645 [Saprospiraceae bacterium]|nr:hypothetical protein [Saprospiraceae bacterium]
MPKQQTDQLIVLIQSLTKAEKRNFRLFANRQNSSEEKLFVQLFDYVEKSRVFHEEDLLKKYPQIKKSQLSNIKANLYRQLLSSLRLLHKQGYEDFAVREMLDSARILHSKGMYSAALDMLEKAKKTANQLNDAPLAYAALDFERKIENQHITGSMADKALSIKEQSDTLVSAIRNSNDLANLSLLLYGLYLKYGYVKDDRDYEYISTYFNAHLPKISVRDLNFYEKLYYFQSLVWYYHMVQDFANYYKFSQKWVETFESEPVMIEKDTALYIKGLHNALNALYMAGKREKFAICFQKFEIIGDSHSPFFSTNDHSVYQLVHHIHLLNSIFLTGEYDKGVKQLQPLELALKKNVHNWDNNKIMVFYYKIACVYFGADEYGKSLTYLNLIINGPSSDLRLDIQCFARFLSLIAHYELGNEVLVSYQIKSVYRFLSNMEDLQGVQKEILAFLRKTPRIYPSEVKTAFRSLRSRLLQYKDHPYEKRPFLYLDIIAWLDSKINGSRIQTEIREKIK